MDQVKSSTFTTKRTKETNNHSALFMPWWFFVFVVVNLSRLFRWASWRIFA